MFKVQKALYIFLIDYICISQKFISFLLSEIHMSITYVFHRNSFLFKILPGYSWNIGTYVIVPYATHFIPSILIKVSSRI